MSEMSERLFFSRKAARKKTTRIGHENGFDVLVRVQCARKVAGDRQAVRILDIDPDDLDRQVTVLEVAPETLLDLQVIVAVGLLGNVHHSHFVLLF